MSESVRPCEECAAPMVLVTEETTAGIEIVAEIRALGLDAVAVTKNVWRCPNGHTTGT